MTIISVSGLKKLAICITSLLICWNSGISLLRLELLTCIVLDNFLRGVTTITLTQFSMFPMSHVHFLERGLSDHSPIAVFTGTLKEVIHKPFQLFHHLLSLPDFSEVVRKAWNVDFTGNPWYILTQKLKRVKAALKLINSNTGDLHQKVEAARNALLSFQSTMPTVPTVQYFQEEGLLCSQLRKALMDEVVFLKQKSRVHWLKNGDNNNPFFFNSCKGRWNVNKITALL